MANKNVRITGDNGLTHFNMPYKDMGDGTFPPIIAEPNVSTETPIAGQITVTTPGTSVQGPNTVITNGVMIKALSGNAGKIYVYSTSGDNRLLGYELEKNQPIPLRISNLNQLWFDSSVGGDKLCWIKL